MNREASAPHVARIAHRAGNDRRALQLAVAAAVDWIEIDVWYSYGRLVARHEWGFGSLPVVYDNWRLHLLRERPMELGEIVRLTDGGPRLFIDLKGKHRRLPRAVVDVLRRSGATGRAAVCGQHWPLLDAIASAEPGVEIFHSLGRPEHVDAYAARQRLGPPPAGISIAKWLLTPELVAYYRQQQLRVFAWTVNDDDRAFELVAWGVDGIISDRLDLLRALP